MSVPRLSDFTVAGHLGEGGTATVSEVSSELYRQNIALKRPLENSNCSKEEFSKLIHREYDLIKNHTFPGLVKLHTISTEDEPFLLMELCRGVTLDKLGRIDDPIQAMNLISAIALNLEYLRLVGLVHCDLKPHNIFLPNDYSLSKDKLFYLKISDFSLARRITEDDQARVGLGTVGYMPPETTNSNLTSHRSDLFALGVIAYQLLTGHHPFAENESDPIKINGRVQEDTPVDIAQYRSDIADEVISLVNNLLSKKPDDRPNSAWEVCQILEKAGAGYPYRRALHPRYLFIENKNNQPDEKHTWLSLKNKRSQQLINYCGTDPSAQKLLVTANFRNNNLYYDGSNFTSHDDLYWPVTLRRKLLTSFSKLTLSDKKKVIHRAVYSLAQTNDANDTTSNNPIEFPASFYDLLVNLLNPATIMRTASKLAREAVEKNDHQIAAYLYPVSGNLSQAEESAFLAANQLVNDNRPDEAIRLLKQTVELARLKDKLSSVRQLLMLLGDIYKSIGETEHAETVYGNLLDIYKSLPVDKLLAETYKDLGEINRIKKNFEAGLVHLNNALKIYQKLNDELELSRTYNNIGNIYFTTSDFKSALHNYRLALKIKRRINDEHDLGQTLNNIGTVFGARGNYTRAKLFFEFSLNLNKKLGRKVEIARALNNLGYTYFYCGELDRATESLMKAFKINKEIGTNNELLFNYDNLTSVMLISGQLEQTAQHLGEAIGLAKQLVANSHVASFSLGLSSVYRRMGKYSMSLQAFEHARSIIENLDDADLKIRLRIEQAETSFELGQIKIANKQALDALRMAEEADQRLSILNSLLLLTRIEYNEKQFEQARKIISQMKLSREGFILLYNRLEQLITQDAVDIKESCAEFKLDDLGKIESDVELPRYCNIAAELMIQQGKSEIAMKLAERALFHAQRSTQRPEIVKSYATMGNLHNEKKDYQEAYQLYRKAIDCYKEIISEIDNPDDQQVYQSNKTIRLLIANVQKLARVMQQK